MSAVRLAALAAFAAASALAWEGPRLTRDAAAAPVSRTWADVRNAIAASIAKTGDGYYAYSRRYNDIGPIDTAGTLTDEELKTQFAMACVLASPITVRGARLKPQLEKWLRDGSLMNVNNDFVGRQGHVVAGSEGALVIVKYLWGMNGGACAAAFYNPTETARKVAATARELGFAGTVRWADKFDAAAKGEFAGTLAFDVPAHGTRLVLLTGTPAMREAYRPECGVERDGALLFECVFVPRDGTYELTVEAEGAYRVRVNGLAAGSFDGTATVTVPLMEPENAVRLEGLTKKTLRMLRVRAR